MFKFIKSPLFSLILVVFIDMLGVGIAIPTFAALFFGKSAILNHNLSPETVNYIYGAMLATYPFFQLFGSPFIGDLSDRLGRKKLLVFSIGGTFIGYLLTYFGIITANLPIIFLGRVIDGFTGGNISVAQSAISDVSKPEDKTKNYGLIGMAFGLGFIIGPFIGGKLSDSTFLPFLNISIPFLFTAVLTLINLMFVVFSLKETNKNLKEGDYKFNIFAPIVNLKKIKHLKSIQTLFLVMFLFALGFSFFTQFFQVYLIDKFNFTVGNVGDLFAYIGVWIVITQGFIIRKIHGKFNEKTLASVSLLALSFFMLIQIFAFNPFLIFFLSTFVSVFNGLVNPNLMALISKETDPKSIGEVFGINQSIVCISQIIPALLAGVALNINIYLPIILASFFILLSGLVLSVKYRK